MFIVCFLPQWPRQEENCLWNSAMPAGVFCCFPECECSIIDTAAKHKNLKQAEQVVSISDSSTNCWYTQWCKNSSLQVRKQRSVIQDVNTCRESDCDFTSRVSCECWFSVCFFTGPKGDGTQLCLFLIPMRCSREVLLFDTNQRRRRSPAPPSPPALLWLTAKKKVVKVEEKSPRCFTLRQLFSSQQLF